jgi:hypothetical protein
MSNTCARSRKVALSCFTPVQRFLDQHQYWPRFARPITNDKKYTSTRRVYAVVESLGECTVYLEFSLRSSRSLRSIRQTCAVAASRVRI